MKSKKGITLAVCIFLAGVVMAYLTLFNGGCPHQNGEELTDIEKLRYTLVQAQAVLNQVDEELPELYLAVDSLCPILEGIDTSLPEWCAEIPTAKKDVENALDALSVLIKTTIAGIDAGQIKDPVAITSAVVKALADLTKAYLNIQAIIQRHSIE